jgi:hypothetical protein
MARLRSCGWETRHWMARLRSLYKWETRHWLARLRSCGWETRHWMARLAFVPTSDKTRLGVWRSEQAVRTCSLILWWCGWVDLGKLVLADVRLGGSAAAGGGDLVGSVSRRAAGARSSLFLLLCVTGAVASYLRHDIDSFGPIKFSATLDLNDRRT